MEAPLMDQPNRCIALLVIFSWCFISYANAQEIDEQQFGHYTRLQGLSGNLVTGIAQDSIGYIWASTSSGLNRFNGSHFVQFHSDDNLSSLPSENLSGMEQVGPYR